MIRDQPFKRTTRNVVILVHHFKMTTRNVVIRDYHFKMTTGNVVILVHPFKMTTRNVVIRNHPFKRTTRNVGNFVKWSVMEGRNPTVRHTKKRTLQIALQSSMLRKKCKQQMLVF